MAEPEEDSHGSIGEKPPAKLQRLPSLLNPPGLDPVPEIPSGTDPPMAFSVNEGGGDSKAIKKAKKGGIRFGGEAEVHEIDRLILRHTIQIYTIRLPNLTNLTGKEQQTHTYRLRSR